jgi:alpha-galactosidase
MAPDAIGPEQTRDLRAAFEHAARPQPLAEPLDWQHTIWPSRWRLNGEEVRYTWISAAE